MSARMSSILHSSPTNDITRALSFTKEEIPADQTEEVSALKRLLYETGESQRSLEREMSLLKRDKQDQDKYIKELSGYIRTQDHIYNLKLKEREILLRELTQQTNDLRGQVIKDKRVFDEMKELADCNLPKLGIQKIKAKKLISKNRKEEMPFFKLDLNNNDVNASRPATSGGLQAFSASLPHSSTHLTRPDSSPALHVNVTNSVHDYCGAASPLRPSLFSSTGITSKKVEQSWQEEPVAEKLFGLQGDDHSTGGGAVRFEVEEVRRKVALLVSHQDITMKRLRAKPGVSMM